MFQENQRLGYPMNLGKLAVTLFALTVATNAIFAADIVATPTAKEQVGYQYLSSSGYIYAGNYKYLNIGFSGGDILSGEVEFDVSSINKSDIVGRSVNLVVYAETSLPIISLCEASDNTALTGNVWNDSNANLFPVIDSQITADNLIDTFSASSAQEIVIDVTDYVQDCFADNDSLNFIGFSFVSSNSSFIGKMTGYDTSSNMIKLVFANPIPEPSTFAVIFGALALGFVIYRRRNV